MHLIISPSLLEAKDKEYKFFLRMNVISIRLGTRSNGLERLLGLNVEVTNTIENR